MWGKDSGHEPGGFENESMMNESIAPTKTEGAGSIQSVVPICVRQLKEHPGEDFALFGVQVQMVTIVGILKEYEVQSTKATYEIEDHTGQISAIWWLEGDSTTTPNLPIVKEGCYIRVYGSIRKQEGRIKLMILRMFPVDDLNEITTHLLEVIHTRLEAENLKKNKGNFSMIKRNNPNFELANSMSGIDNQEITLDQSGLNPLQQKVYNILKSSNTASGASTASVCQQFAQNQHKDVRAALEFLIAEGHAYSTIDNEHYKVTETM
ncbi:replication protein A 32 kDa subunit [Onthophagus taurus]|uniref:replication protein A 32 kDa subunit n=1 Tax=Onthophagus taurus TaxID=166361 RepID=UPI000C200219|nr:replication protein A 32 kDa subunit [Onthophagus taurus]